MGLQMHQPFGKNLDDIDISGLIQELE